MNSDTVIGWKTKLCRENVQLREELILTTVCMAWTQPAFLTSGTLGWSLLFMITFFTLTFHYEVIHCKVFLPSAVNCPTMI